MIPLAETTINVGAFIGTLIVTLLTGPLVTLVFWLIFNRNRLKDKWNLRFKRSRVVKVNVKTVSNRLIEKFLVPDSRGFIHFNGGVYRYDQAFASYSARYHIPEITICEGQIEPASPALGVLESEIEMEVLEADGKTVTVKKQKVPTYFLSMVRSHPKKLKIDGAKGDITAQEVKNLLESYIVERITLANSEMVKRQQLIFIMLIGVCIAVPLVGIILYSKVSHIELLTQNILTTIQVGLRNG